MVAGASGARGEGVTKKEMFLVEDGNLDIRVLLARLWSRRLVIAAAGFIGLLFAILYLHLATYIYTATLKVGPTPNLQAMNSPAPSGLSGLASLAGLGNGRSTQSLSPFDLYLETLTSRETGNALARQPDLMRSMFSAEWDSASGSWRAPPSFKRDVLNVIRGLLGTPLDIYRPPDGARMQAMIQQSLGIGQDPKKTLVALSFSSPDPKFAVFFLQLVNTATDSQIRSKAQQHADVYIDYLNKKLATVTNADHRVVLMQALGEQERFRMMASSNLPYAADVYDGPAASPYTTSPKPAMVLALGMLAGLAIGVGLALLTSGGLLSASFARLRGQYPIR